jgi:hypothetical protein
MAAHNDNQGMYMAGGEQMNPSVDPSNTESRGNSAKGGYPHIDKPNNKGY